MRRTKRGQRCGLIGGTIALLVNPVLGWSIATAIGAIAHLTPPSARAATLNQWQFNPETRELLITLPTGTIPRYFLMAQPPRIILELPNTQLGAIVEQENYAGAVRRIRVAQFQPDLARIVIELAPDTEFAPGQVELRVLDETNGQANQRWVLRPLLADSSSETAIQAEVTEPEVTEPEVTEPEVSTEVGVPSVTIAPSVLASPSLETPTSTIDAAEAAPVATTPALPTVMPAPISPAAPPVLEQAQMNQPEAASPDDSIESETDTSVTPEAAANMAPVTDSSVTPAEAETEAGAEDEAEEAIAIPIQAPMTASTAESTLDRSTVEPAPTPTSVHLATPQTEALNPEAPPPLELPTILPPASFSPDRSATIRVPPLMNADSAPRQRPSLPPARPAEASTTQVTVPPPRTPARLSEAESTTPTARSATSLGSPLTAATPITPATPPAPLTPQPAPTSPAAPPPISFAPAATAPVSYNGYVIEFGNPLPAQSDQADEVVFSNEDALISEASPAVELPEEPNSSEQNDPTENLEEAEDAVEQSSSPVESIAIATTNTNLEEPLDASVLLPSDAVLSLRYPGLTPLELQDGPPWQEVLLVDQPIYDRTGEVLIPAGSEVIGRFETSSRGSRFIAQAISLNGQNIRLEGSSERRSSVIQPDQIVEVRLTDAISRQN